MVNWLPRLAVLFALLAWGATIFFLPGLKLSLSSTIIIAGGLAIATLLTLLAQNPSQRGRSGSLWLSAGLWAGASFLNPNALGLAYLLAGLVTVASAWTIERAAGRFSLNGPALFVAALLGMYFLDQVFMP